MLVHLTAITASFDNPAWPLTGLMSVCFVPSEGPPSGRLVAPVSETVLGGAQGSLLLSAASGTVADKVSDVVSSAMVSVESAASSLPSFGELIDTECT